MLNAHVPAAAKGLPKQFTDLEDPIADAANFARIANLLATKMMSVGGRDDLLTMYGHEADLVLFATLQAKLAAERAADKFYALLETAR